MRFLKKTGIITESFEAEALFDLKLSEIKQSVQSLFELLVPLVAEPDQAQKQPTQSKSTATRATLTVARSTPIVAPGDQTAASAPYVSATEEVESSDSEEPPRMTLGPAGAAILQNRVKQTAGLTTENPRDTLEAMMNSNRHPPEKLESFFQAAMEKFLKEQQVPQTRPKIDRRRIKIHRRYHNGHHEWPSNKHPRIRVSALSELKEFAGKDGDEDRARSWLGKVKSAFIRDQAPDQEKCLVFGDLFTRPARNWYRQLSRTTRSTWRDLHQSFQVQYCGRGVSVARQYYHARKRSDESPQEYLHRLNVAGLRTRLQIKDSPPDVRREHVEHFIETLDDHDLADQLALLRNPDAETLEEVLRSRKRAKSRQSKTVYGSIMPRQKSPAAAAGTWVVRAVHVPEDISDSDEESASRSRSRDRWSMFCDAWVGPPIGGQDLILGMDFMVPPGIRLDLADGTICLPDEVRIQLAGRRPLYGDKVEQGHLAVLPQVTPTTKEVKIEDIQVGDPHGNTQEQVDRLKHIIWRRRHLLIGKGNALPPAAKGAICDIDVGNAKPVAQRIRKVAPQFHEKLFQLIKGLLSAKIIQHSTSPWASPIVVIVIKNGIDIRLCLDYRLVNSLTRLMVYPMPLINDLLDDLDKVLWYCSLDMASGFWVVSMTDRARAISAFITPFGLFEWNRMPFGLKKAPQIYQRLLDNALYGFLKINKRQDHQARNAGDQGQQRPIDLFRDGEPDTDKASSVLGRRSYIDGILVTAESWDMLCERVDTLLDACDEWNLSISVAKSFRGLKKEDYLRHRISAGGMEARPKDLSSLADLPFPTTLRSMQTFPGSLNYYSRFIEDFAIYASILYELRETDFFEASGQAKTRLESDYQDQLDKWTGATKAFVVLKDEIVNAPNLTHFDPDKRPVVIWYASKWAISTALVQEHEGVYKPVTFTSRTLKPNEINYGIVDKEVLALLRMLNVSYTELVTRSIKRGGGAFSAIVWSLPDWTVISGASEYKANITVNDAEYHGLLLCFDLLAKQHVDHNRLIICRDSNLVIRQMRGEIKCKDPSLKLLRQKAMEKLRSWPNHEFLHVKRDWNQSTDKLASAALQRKAGEQVTSQIDIDDLTTLNRLAELLVPQSQISVVKIAATTRSRQRRGWEMLQEPLVQRMGVERIGRAQDEEKWIFDLKKYLTGDVRERGSPGNLQATYPLQIIAMDHIPSLPKSYKGNTELLIWIDLFTGYVIAKASASRTAQTIAENYEECVFRRFGASEMIRHDREPGFMADFFRSFNKIVGQKQRATMAYRPQANGIAERMVQTLTRSIASRNAGVTMFNAITSKREKLSMNDYEMRSKAGLTAIMSQSIHPYEIEVGMQVWLYLDRGKEGYAQKLAHMWHGPCRVAAMIDTHAVRLEIAGTKYRLFLIVHTSKLKPVQNFSDRPKVPLVIEDQDRFDFDEAFLPEVSWDTSLA
ncbi:unnamed protein product [Phytophthora fragariaefolia]|uniref:Unnamed protein product n=1 Tax=Phytophthora fragariaefolia TaxID=1490495 RepID=A0A9W6TKV2_9STRA|nr:unnamed protein product [Phytophthora fragariaefolia]